MAAWPCGAGDDPGSFVRGDLVPQGSPLHRGASRRRALGSKENIRRFFQTHYSAKSWRKDRRVIARVEATTLGSGVRFIVTNIAGSKAKHLYEKACCARGRMENLPFHRLKVNDCRVTDQGAQALFTIRPDFMPSLGGEPVPTISAHRRLLAHASPAECSSKKVPMAKRHIRDHPQYIHQNCCPCGANENAHPPRLFVARSPGSFHRAMHGKSVTSWMRTGY